MEQNQPMPLVIREHNFQEAKNALKQYTEQVRKEVKLDKLATKGVLFNLSKRKVTREELNNTIGNIQDFIKNINNLNLGFVEEFEQVYKAFEHLDKDYIAGIVTSIKAAEEVSKQEQKDRKDIKELVGQHEQAVTVLKKFKQDIDQLKHLTDVDKAWELIENQTRLSEEFADYISNLSKLEHLQDVDATYADLERLKQELTQISETQSKYAIELKSVHEYCDMLSKMQHITDIDKLWDSNKSLTEDVQSIKKTLEDQSKTISDFHEALQRMQKAQRQFIDTVNKTIADFCGGINDQIKAFTETQTALLNSIERNFSDAVNELSIKQEEKLTSIEKTHNETLGTIAKEQMTVLSKIEQVQQENMEQLSVNQSEALEQIACDQSAKLAEISEAFEAEKTALNEKVSVLTQKIKLAYGIAGGAVALTIIQLLLRIMGVI